MNSPTPNSYSFRAKLRYWFDGTMSRGAIALMGWLAVVTATLVVLGAIALQVAGIHPAGNESAGALEGIWATLTRAMDAGTFTGDPGWTFRGISLLVTLAGIFIFSTLIGIIMSSIDRQLERLRKGRSPVIETGHTLVLGWSAKVHSIISELAIANENQKDGCIVIMAPHDKVEMEDTINAINPRRTLGNTRIVCRNGDPARPADLALVHPAAAKSVVVLCPQVDDGGDAQVVKVVLSLMSFDREFSHLNVVAELDDEMNARVLEQATEDRIRTVVTTDVIAKITAQICRQSGLSPVYQELLDFDGDEVYFHNEPSLVGKTFGETLLAFSNASVFGVRREKDGVQIAPSPDYVLQKGDQLIAIAEDDDVFELDPYSSSDEDTDIEVPSQESIDTSPRRTLLVGWNGLASGIARELDQFAPSGSRIDVLVDPDLVTIRTDMDDFIGKELTNTEMHILTSGGPEAEWIILVLAREKYNQVILLGYREGISSQNADARTLLSLLQVRRAIPEMGVQRDTPGRKKFSVVTELLDASAVDLVRIANPDDFVVSDQLTSLLLAQLSENPELEAVFNDLLGSGGSELRLIPANLYHPANKEVSFRTYIKSASLRGEVVIGYRRAPGSTLTELEKRLGSGIVINPRKDLRITLSEHDDLIVLAQEISPHGNNDSSREHAHAREARL